MRALLADSLAAGGLGFSSSQSRTHSDGDGRPITSRHADRREMLAFCEEVAAHEGTTLEYITNGCLDSVQRRRGRPDDRHERHRPAPPQLERPHRRRPLGRPDGPSALGLVRAAAEAGGRIVALTMPTLVPMNMSFRTLCALFLMPGWGDVMGLPAEERMAKLADPDVRALLDERAQSKEAGVVPRPGPLGHLRHRRHLRRRQRGLYQGQTVRGHRRRPGHAPTSTPCSTSCWPTSCAPSCGPTPTTATRRPGPCGRRSGATPGPWSAGPTPAPTSTACADRATRRLPGGLPPGAPAGAGHEAVHMMSGQPAAALRAPRPRRAGGGQRGRRLRLRPRHGGFGAGPPGPRPPRRRRPPHRRIARRRAGPRQRGGDGARRAADRAVPGTLLRSGRDTASVLPAGVRGPESPARSPRAPGSGDSDADPAAASLRLP